MPDLEARLRAAGALIAEGRDLLSARADDEVPPPLVSRGWDGWLAALDDEALSALEIGGVDARWPADTPGALRELLEAARAIAALPRLDAAVTSATIAPKREQAARRRGESPRKRAQVEAFTRVIARGPGATPGAMPGVVRAIDVGAGHGYLTRAVAAALGAGAQPPRVIGLERDEARVRRARALATDVGATFERADVLQDGLALARGDLALGLHACGELGDHVVEVAAEVGASVALVGCCLQKRRGDARAALVASAVPAAAASLPKAILGLSNAIARDQGVEASRAENLAARERRVALRWLLAARDVREPPGREMAGLNRRAAHLDLATFAARALAARGLPPAAPLELEAAERHARARFAQLRRWSLPRAQLARPLEIFVALDRACHLARRGHDVRVGTLFDDDVSARNLLILARAT